MAVCPACRTPLSAEDRFCSACGAATAVEIAFSPYNYNTTSDTEQLINATIDSAADELLWTT